MIAPELADSVQPLPWHVIVERDEVARSYGGVWLPPSYTGQVKNVQGTVVEVGEAVSGVTKGDRVLLGAGVSRHIAFGHGPDRVLYVCRRNEIVGVWEGLPEDIPDEVTNATRPGEGMAPIVDDERQHRLLEGKVEA